VLVLGHQQGGRGRTRRAAVLLLLPPLDPAMLSPVSLRTPHLLHALPSRAVAYTTAFPLCQFDAWVFCALPQPDHRQAALPRQFVAVPALSACLAHHTQASQAGTQSASPERNAGEGVRVAWLCGDMVEGHADEQRYFLASPWPIRLRSWNNEHSNTQKKSMMLIKFRARNVDVSSDCNLLLVNALFGRQRARPG